MRNLLKRKPRKHRTLSKIELDELLASEGFDNLHPTQQARLVDMLDKEFGVDVTE